MRLYDRSKRSADLSHKARISWRLRDRGSHSQDFRGVYRHILIVEEASREAVPSAAEEYLRDEPGGIIAAFEQELRQGGKGRIKGPIESGGKLVRPPPREHAGVRRERPGGRGPCLAERHPSSRELPQRRRRRTRIAVKIQAFRPDSIEHDEQDIRRRDGAVGSNFSAIDSRDGPNAQKIATNPIVPGRLQAISFRV